MTFVRLLQMKVRCRFYNLGNALYSQLELKYDAGSVSLYTDRSTQVGKFDDVLQLSPFITLGTSVHASHLGKT